MFIISIENMKKLKPYFDLLLGILYLLFTTLEYYPCFNKVDAFHLGDWCFITGIIGGLFFIVLAVLAFLKKDKDLTFLELYNTCLLCIIFLGTITIGLNVNGYLIFIHIVGPLLVLFRFFYYTDCRKIKKLWYLLFLGIVPVVYVIFAFILLKVSGDCPFPAKMLFFYENNLIPYGLTLLLILVNIIFGGSLYFLNRFINKKRDK